MVFRPKLLIHFRIHNIAVPDQPLQLQRRHLNSAASEKCDSKFYRFSASAYGKHDSSQYRLDSIMTE